MSKCEEGISLQSPRLSLVKVNKSLVFVQLTVGFMVPPSQNIQGDCVQSFHHSLSTIDGGQQIGTFFYGIKFFLIEGQPTLLSDRTPKEVHNISCVPLPFSSQQLFDVPQKISRQHGDDSGPISIAFGLFYHGFEGTKVFQCVPAVRDKM